MNIRIIKYDILTMTIIIILAAILGYNISYYGIEGDMSSSFQSWNRQISTLKITEEFPLWDQQAWGGMTFIGQIMQPVYPVLWILKFFYFNSIDNTLSISILFAMNSIHMVIFTLGLFILLRIIGYSIFSSFIVSLMVSCSTIIHSQWLFIWGATSYIPILLVSTLLLIKNLNNQNLSLFFSFIIGLILSLTFFIAGVWVGISALYITLVFCIYIYDNYDNFYSIFRLFLFLVFAAIISFFIASVQILPMIETSLISSRFVPNEGFIPVLQKVLYNNFIAHSISVSDIINLINKDSKIGISLPLYIFMLIGFFIKSNSFILRYARLLFVFGFLSTFGIVLPLILYKIPIVNSIRELFVYSPFIGIAVSILAAEGIEYLLKNKIRLNDLFFVPLFLFLILLIFFKGSIFNNEDLIIFVFLILLIITNLITTKNKKLIYISYALFIILTSLIYYWKTISNKSLLFNNDKLEKRYQSHKENLKPLLELISDNTRIGYFYPYRFMSWTAEVGIGDFEMFGHRGVYTYLNPVYNSALAVHGMDIQKRVIIQNVKYLLIDTNNEYWLNLVKTYGYKNLGSVKYEKTFDGDIGNLTVFETNAIGEAWFVDSIETYNFDTTDEISYNQQIKKVNFINQQYFDPLKTAILKIRDYNNLVTSIDTLNNFENSVKLVKILPNNILYRTTNKKSQLMVTSNFNYPGWNVYVDGKKVDIVEINSAFIGVLLDKGTHEVELKYEPMSFKIGVFLNLFVLALILVYIVYNFNMWIKKDKFVIEETNK